MSSGVNSKSCLFCYIDFDINNHRSNLALAAAFVDATDSRYGFSSKHLLKLGGSELSRISDSLLMDHEWGCKAKETIVTKLPQYGSRVVFRLYWDVAPLACENFATLCVNGGNSLDICSNPKKPKPAPIGESGKALTYRSSSIHRVVPGFIVQGGDFVMGNGAGGESIYNGKKFKDEKAGLMLKHDRELLLSMGNSGKNSNTSQFFVTFAKAPQCDGKHVIFGEVISGKEVISELEQHGSSSGEPSVPIQITDCGAYHHLFTPGAGSWYDRPDPDSYSGKTPELIVQIRVGVLAPTMAVAEKFRSALGEHATTVLIAADEVEGGDDEITRLLMKPLEKFSLDVVLAAPACSSLLESLEVPSSWTDAANALPKEVTAPTKGEVFLVAKPVNALAAIMDKSWVAKRDGWILSSSFV
jgi:peptidylprolyl isomerase